MLQVKGYMNSEQLANYRDGKWAILSGAETSRSFAVEFTLDDRYKIRDQECIAMMPDKNSCIRIKHMLTSKQQSRKKEVQGKNYDNLDG